ncbi:MAG: diguanylate cyclase [bacterium]
MQNNFRKYQEFLCSVREQASYKTTDTIGFRIMSLIVGGITVTALLIGWFSLSSMGQYFQKRVSLEFNNALSMAGMVLENQIRKFKDQIIILDNEIAESIIADSIHATNDILNAYRKTHPFFQEFVIIDTSRKLIGASNPRSFIVNNFVNKMSFEQIHRNIHYQSMIDQHGNNNPYVAIILRSKQTRQQFYICGIINLSELDSLFFSLSKKLPFKFTLTDQNKLLLIAGEKEQIYPAVEMGSAGPVELKLIQNLYIYQNYSGRRILGMIKELPFYKLKIICEGEYNEFYKPFLNLRQHFLYILPLVLLIFTFLAFFAIRHISRPIVQLARISALILKGQYGLQVETQAKGEIGLLADTFNTMSSVIEDDKKSIEAANKRLEELSITDPLSGLYNKRHFQSRLESEINRTCRSKEPFSLAMIDIDNFKTINDTQGHPVGDKVIAEIGRILKTTVRKIDVCVRYGGEEFAVLLLNTNISGAQVAAEKIRTGVEKTPILIPNCNEKIQVSVSIGIAQYDPEKEDLIKRADDALYISKKNGKNRVSIN